MSIVCFTHSRDFDGHCSGAIVKKKYPDAEIIGYDYGEPFPWEKIKDQTVIMVDVSLPMHEMSRISMESKHFTWIDHHKSAIDAYNDAVENGIGFRSMDVHVLEVGRAACELTWEYLFPGEELPLAVLLLGAYDVWRKKDLKAWEEQVMPFQYGIRMESSSVDTFPMTLLDSDYRVEGIIQIGNSILEYQKGQNEGLMKGAFKTEVHGYQAVCCNIGLVNFNSQSFSSVFDPEEDEIMIAFCYLGPSLDQWRISFYTEDPNIDVSVLAKKYGGGGHRGAAGCQVRNWKQVISNI